MRVEYHPNFIKAYKKRIEPNARLAARFDERVKLFVEQPSHPMLQNHSLSGVMRELCAFSITGDFRVIFQPRDDGSVLFVDIGTHNQVY